MRKLLSSVLVVLAAACSSSKSDPVDEGGDEVGDDPAAPEDDVIDESAGEDALAVLKGEKPGVAFIVEYADGSDVDAVSEGLAADYTLTITSRYHDLVGGAFIAADQNVMEQVRLDPRVKSLAEDRIVAMSPGDAFDDQLAAFESEAAAAGEIDAESAAADKEYSIGDLTPQHRSTGWRLIHGERAIGDGAGTRVAVIDTGIDMFHPDLTAAVSDMGKDCVRRKNKTRFDFNGHGSHVSGIIAAQNNGFGMVGLAPATRIVPVRSLNSKGEGSVSSILCGVDYVLRRTDKIDVVNLSIGGTCGGDCEEFEELPHDRALRKLVGRGVTVVVAAGNEGIDADESDPAYIDEVITVSAYMDWNGALSSRDRYAHFSNFGPGVDIGAPGVRIMSTIPDGKYARWSGTSMATPFVTAAAAVLIGAGEVDTPDEVRSRLLDSAHTSYPGRGGDHPERLLQFADEGAGCGDAVCQGTETDESCPADCGCAASACASPAPYGCYCDTDCEASGDCCADADICPIM